MKRYALLCLSLLSLPALPALAADCVFYKDPNRVGSLFEQNSNQNTVYHLAAVANDQISSVWVKDGFYAVLFEHAKYQGNKTYVYGSGLSFARNAWGKTFGKIADGGAAFNLNDLSFNELTSSVLCLKE